MVTEQKISARSELRTAFDILMVGIGVFTGGIAALLLVWLWFDYQADPNRSLLVLVSANLPAALPSGLQAYLLNQARLMGLPLAGETPAFWYMARSGGIVAYLLLWLSTVWGLVLSTKITDRLIPAPIIYGLHEFLSLGTIFFTVIHAAVLLGDGYINFNLLHLLIPFTAPYEPFWTGLGVTGFYLTAALTGSFYIRKRIGQKTWRKLHYLTFLAYVLALIHGLMAGTDAPLPVMKLMYLVSGFSVLFLVYYRLFTMQVKEKKPVRNQA